jgi:serine/threonine protein kinase
MSQTERARSGRYGVLALSEHTLDAISEDGEFVTSRVRRGRDDLLVVSTSAEHPARETLARLEHWYALRHELDPAGSARAIDLLATNGPSHLIPQDPGGELLARLLGRPMDLGQALWLAIEIVHALGGMHARGLIHRDVKPASMLVNAVMGESWLTGFWLSLRQLRVRQGPEPLAVIAGTLAYMAPEQTGRMNRSTDSRSDLYAFGVTLYEMLTGELPFVATAPMELVHCRTSHGTRCRHASGSRRSLNPPHRWS